MDARELVLGTDNPSPLMTGVRLGFRALSSVAPEIAARTAGRLWFTPPRPPIRPSRRAFLATGKRFDLTVNGRHVVAWSWGGGPAVVFMHGWGGYGAQIESFVGPLVARGFRAVTFDAPSHGLSGASRLGTRRSSFFDFSDALVAVAREVAPLAAVIAHSGGCTSTAWAIRSRADWNVPAAVFLAPMGSPAAYTTTFQQALGISDDVVRRFRSNTERRLEFRWEELEMSAVPRAVSTPPVLVVHDRDDRETPWEEGAQVAATWPRSELLTTTGLGHRRILRDASVVEAVVRFIQALS